MSRRVNPVITLIRKANNTINTKTDVANFYVSALTSLLTIITLVTTVYFSLSALQRTDVQNINAAEQLKEARKNLKLAQDQFNYSKRLHTEDSLSNVMKDSISNKRFIDDTIKQGKREHSQEERNKLQDKSNQQQYELNKGQLAALELQARTSKAQFEYQQDQYRQQIYEQRAIINIDSSHVEHINSVKSTIYFTFSNVGARPAHVDSTLLAFYSNACFSVTPNVSNLDAIPNRTSLLTSTINIYNDCLNDKRIIYYLIVYYKDTITNKSLVEPIFFTYEYDANKRFVWRRVYGSALNDFKRMLKRKGVFF